MHAQINGIRLDYEVAGDGPTVLLIHGFPLNRGIWNAQVEALSRTCRVVLPDVRGHGRTETPEGPYPMDLMARDMFGLMDHLGIREFGVAGHSMGGYIIFAMHGIAPERLARIAFVTSRAVADTEEGRRARRINAERVRSEGVGFLADTMSTKTLRPVPDPAVVEQVRAIVGQASPPPASPERSAEWPSVPTRRHNSQR